MKYLLDTNVVSELRKAGTTKIDSSVAKWFEGVPTVSCYLSVITLLEIEMGILSIERKDKSQAGILRQWFDKKVIPAFADRIIAIDVTIALQCARLHIPDRKPERDALIAATALVHSMTLVTRNVKDFVGEGVCCIDPWDSSISSK